MSDQKTYRAIVVGSSAGGLSALTILFQNLPLTYPLPVLVVQHRSKDQNELLENVLQQKCRIRIKQADDKEEIQPGVIYIAPPDYHLMANNDGTLSLSVDEHVQFSRPSINVLFETAAEAFRNDLLGIILTGTSSDGANGISAIRQLGGTTIAQDPAEARYSYMPIAAIDTGAVQYTWTLSRIQEYLLNLNKQHE